MSLHQGARLFVPLSQEPFQWFSTGRKNWELRRHGRQFTERHVRVGRRVELRRGYSDPRASLWGTIDEVVIAGSIEIFFDLVPFRMVIPSAKTSGEAVATAAGILGLTPDAGRVIGFRIDLDANS
jgi:hypothetical protein